MTGTVSFKGKTYEIKQDISFGDLIELQELKEQIDAAQKLENAKERDKLLNSLGSKNLRKVADTLHNCLGFTGADLKKFSLHEAMELVTLVIARSAEPDPN